MLVDHWIGVHPEQGIKAPANAEAARSQVRPVRAFLRILATDTREKAEAARTRIVNGEDFFDVASQTSTDPSRATGGYIGPTTLADLDPRLADAAAQLRYGEISVPVEFRGGWVILGRLPRDFRLDAERLLREAQELKAKGETRQALERDQQALKLNPSFLRALVFMGATLGEMGRLQRAANVLGVATQLFPKDSEATFDLGIVLGGLGKTNEQVEAFRRAIELDPDNLAPYESLGAALQSNGDSAGAEKAFRDGLQIDPLSAVLNYDLSLVLEHEGDHAAASKARELALKINPKVVPEGK